MLPICSLIIFLAFFNLQGQSATKEIISFCPNEEKELLIPAYKEDTIQLQIDIHNTKRAKKNFVLLYEYPRKLLIKNEKIKSFDKSISAANDGIYTLVLKDDYKYSLEGSRENFKSGIVKISSNEKSYLGIHNPDNLYGIHIAIEIIAVVEKVEQIKQIVNIPIITSYETPYLID